MNSDIIEKLKKEIEGFAGEVKPEPYGEVIESADGVAKIRGLTGAMSQEMLTIETDHGDIAALAFNLEEDAVGAIMLGDFRHVAAGDRVSSTGNVLGVKVGRELIGRVIDPLGVPQDGKGEIFSDPQKATSYLIEKRAPGVLDRQSVNTPLHTGIKAIDSMIPIGRGQRELIIGDRQTGKTAIAIDTILNQAKDGS
ncbi:MAG: F0F1 ATP synthase subunit alpha, partial [bacterium]|nr:F0F1 ATP synthase subunit alpha [bacterium]